LYETFGILPVISDTLLLLYEKKKNGAELTIIQTPNSMLSEIQSMHLAAKNFLDNAPPYSLPLRVPYIGMGSSYFAPLAFKFMGLPIVPEIASEYYNYLHNDGKQQSAVLLSQSGRSSEVLWCRELFDHYIAVVNDTESPLAKSASGIIPMWAGEEKFSSSKTYLNTLLALFKGFGMDVCDTVKQLEENMPVYDAKGKELADALYEMHRSKKLNGIYITGSGPNIGTAMQAGLIMSECTKLCFTGMPMAQYDHGHKETAKDSVVFQIISKGKSYERSKKLSATVRSAGAQVFEVEASGVTENESILHNIIPFNYMSYYLSQKLGVQEMFVVGGKVTEVI